MALRCLTALASAGAVLAAVLLTAPAAHAEDMRARKAAFTAWQAAHPGLDSAIAELKAKTAAIIAAYVPPPQPARYSDLVDRGHTLSAEQRAKARQLFTVAFGLWQSGDFPASKEGFVQGLEIDPSNGMANYYLGDVLQREGNKPAAAIAMDKAKTLAPGTAEALKATVALRSLPPVEEPGLDRSPVIWRADGALAEVWDTIDAPLMVVVPAGEFTMGSSASAPNHSADEGPRRRVRLSAPLAISKNPITVADFARFVSDARYEVPDGCETYENGVSMFRKGRNWRSPGFPQRDDQPVVCVNWDDAQAYVAWLSKKTGHAYRLLSEAEYEYAERSGTSTPFWWGATVGKGLADCASCGSMWDFKQTAPVGSFNANLFKLNDMAGNVYSWTQDCFGTYGVLPSDAAAITSGSCNLRALRGGAWNSKAAALLSAARQSSTSSNRDSAFGFRVARVL